MCLQRHQSCQPPLAIYKWPIAIPTPSVIKHCLYMTIIIQSKNTDVMVLTETWLGHEDQVIINEITPPQYTFFNVPGPADIHGGIAILCKAQLNLRLVPITFDFSTFEYSVIADLKRCIHYVIIYRPPPSVKNQLKTSTFLTDFDNFLDAINILPGILLILVYPL